MIRLTRSMIELFLERLDDVVAHAEFGDAQHVFAAGLGGEHDDRDRPHFRGGLQAREHLHPVHDRHGQVKEDEVGAFALGYREPLDAVGGLDDLAGESFEGAGDDHTDRLAVVHGENFGSHKY